MHPTAPYTLRRVRHEDPVETRPGQPSPPEPHTTCRGSRVGRPGGRLGDVPVPIQSGHLPCHHTTWQAIAAVTLARADVQHPLTGISVPFMVHNRSTVSAGRAVGALASSGRSRWMIRHPAVGEQPDSGAAFISSGAALELAKTAQLLYPPSVLFLGVSACAGLGSDHADPRRAFARRSEAGPVL